MISKAGRSEKTDEKKKKKRKPNQADLEAAIHRSRNAQIKGRRKDKVFLHDVDEENGKLRSPKLPTYLQGFK